jgi:hypothetical protein
MSHFRDKSHRALKRLLANGPLTAVPKRPDDQALLLQLAASRFEPERVYRESEVNEELKRWLQTFCAPSGIDHVTIRRLLVDSRLLTRDKPGSIYRVNRERIQKLEPGGAMNPAQVLAQIQIDREARKRERAT